jgi:hypothetical protein
MFTLETMTKCRVLDVRVLAKKDRKPGDLPGMQMLLRADLPAAVLSMFDGYLPGMLFRKAGAAQGNLDGIEAYELTKIGEHVKRMAWDYAQTGCDIVVDQGLGGPRNITLGDCKVHRVTLTPRQGSSVQVQFCVDAPALSTETRGKLTDLKATDVELTLDGPEIAEDAQQRISTTTTRRRPRSAPTQLPANRRGHSRMATSRPRRRRRARPSSRRARGPRAGVRRRRRRSQQGSTEHEGPPHRRHEAGHPRMR